MLKEYTRKLTKKDGIVAITKGVVVTKIVMCDDESATVHYVRCAKLAKMSKELGISEK